MQALFTGRSVVYVLRFSRVSTSNSFAVVSLDAEMNMVPVGRKKNLVKR